MDTSKLITGIRTIINRYWSFDENQQHAHTWHDKQDCLSKLEWFVKEQEKQQWISVDERLPEIDTRIMAHKKNGLVLELYYNNRKEFMYNQIDQTKQVAHWMPLPEFEK